MDGQLIKWVLKEALFLFQKQLGKKHLDAQNLVMFTRHLPLSNLSSPTEQWHLFTKTSLDEANIPKARNHCLGAPGCQEEVNIVDHGKPSRKRKIYRKYQGLFLNQLAIVLNYEMCARDPAESGSL